MRANVDAQGIALHGRRGDLTIADDVAAALHHSRWCYWPMVRISGRDAGGRPMTVFAVPDGAPRSKFAARPEVLATKAREIVQAIEDAAGN